MSTEETEEPNALNESRSVEAIGVGVALGVALGAAFGNIAVGIAIGVAIGAAFQSKTAKGPCE